MLGISNKLSAELEAVFNHWSKVRITDTEVLKLIEIAMCPNSETLQYLKAGHRDELSAYFINSCSQVFEYAMTAPSQQERTTKGTVFGAYNAVTGYFQNVRSYKDGEAKFKSIMDGTGQSRAQKAFNLCADFAKSGVVSLVMN